MFVGFRVLVIKYLVNVLVLFGTALVGGVTISSYWAPLFLAVPLFLINFSLPFILLLLSVPLSTLALTLAVLVVDTALLAAFGCCLPGLMFADWQAWGMASALVGGVNGLLNWLVYLPAISTTSFKT